MFGMMGFFKSALSAFCVIALSTTFVGLATAQESPTGGVGVGFLPYCKADGDCVGGEACVRGHCRSVQCKINKDCGSDKDGKICVDMQCVQAKCDSDKACEVGTRCAQGRCWWPVLTRGRVDGRDMVVVPGGNFLMGTESADGVSDELPAHLVEIEAFSIDRFEVTAGEFQACIDAGGCKAGSAKTVAEWDECTLGDPLRKDLPMNCVSWDGADSYCRWAGKRLPDEAEWERAAGGGDGRPFPWGYALPTCDTACSNRSGGPGCGTGLPCLPGSRAGDASVYGAFDMGGNLQEWTADWYDRAYYARSPRIHPPGGSESSGQRSVRGGSYHDMTERLRIQSRDRLEPDSRSTRIGFRCAGN